MLVGKENLIKKSFKKPFKGQFETLKTQKNFLLDLQNMSKIHI